MQQLRRARLPYYGLILARLDTTTPIRAMITYGCNSQLTIALHSGEFSKEIGQLRNSPLLPKVVRQSYCKCRSLVIRFRFQLY